jgi:tetratricopeptide (TPR) repeat protein
MGIQPLSHIAMVVRKLFEVGEYERAVRLMLRVNPSSTPAPSMLAEFSQLLSLAEQHSDALRFMTAAMEQGLSGDWVSFLHGNLLKFIGRLDDAAASYEKSIATNADHYLSHHAIAYLGKADDSASRIDRIQSSIGRCASDTIASTYLHYALFKELDSIGETTRAWQALQVGMASKRITARYDAAREIANVDSAISRWRSISYGPDGSVANSGPKPIFIVGMPRTGTTLLERILGGSPDIRLCGELNDFKLQGDWIVNRSTRYADELLLALVESRELMSQLGDRYLEHVAWRAREGRFFTDKNPVNFFLVGPILEAFPDAKLLHISRSPMDSCFSNLKELFGGFSHPYSYSLEDTGIHYLNYRRLMAHWQRLYGDRILNVSYEELATDPAGNAKRVMDYCGLPYSAEQIRIESRNSPVSTASSAQVRQPIHTDSIGAWNRYAKELSRLQMALAENGIPAD